MHQIDFLTTIIDNFWDAGFAFHLAISLLYNDNNLQIRFFCDDKELFLQLKGNLEIQNLTYYDLKDFEKEKTSETIYNFFDRKINFEYLHSFSYNIKLINFSYFLMHDGVQNLHNTSYQSKNVSVTHYIPSLLPEWGWVIISPYIESFKNEIKEKWILSARKVLFPSLTETDYQKTWISIFCYKETFEEIKEAILQDTENFYLLFQYQLQAKNVVNMPFVDIIQYEKILCICDKNLVRGENSLVWALWTWKPFLWDIYKEHNKAHQYKIQDFCQYLQTIGDFVNYFEIFTLFNEEKQRKYFQKFCLEKYMWDFEKIPYLLSSNANLLKNIKKYL